MTDPYGDRDLVSLYDIDNPGGADHDHYRGLADRLRARTIVDLGCGTGLLTRTLARPGRTVLGVDPSPTMIEFARSRPGADLVTWAVGDAGAIPADLVADLIVCTGNAIMHIDPADLPAVFRVVSAALRAGGVLGFETRNPAFREWEQWTPAATRTERDTGIGHLTEWLEITQLGARGRVDFAAHNVFRTGEDRVYTSTLYFRSEAELRELLTDNGFVEVTVSGGWSGEPVSDRSRVLVFSART